MSITKKDFELIARTIAAEASEIRTENQRWDSVEFRTLYRIAIRLAATFLLLNDKFDRDRFVSACFVTTPALQAAVVDVRRILYEGRPENMWELPIVPRYSPT